MAIKTKTTAGPEIEVTESLACDNCGSNIPLVMTDPYKVTQQGDNALGIIFSGGYGMYVDPIGEDPRQYEMLWCDKCANSLADMYPSIGKRIGRGYKQQSEISG